MNIDTISDVAEKNINDYMGLVETIAKIEYGRLTSSAHLIDYSELVNIGAITVHLILSNNKTQEHNNSYMSTAIKWAIRNELRRRYKWYSFKSTSPKEKSVEVDVEERSQIRETVYEAILSIEELASAENPTQIRDESHTPFEMLEFRELSNAIKVAMKTLPEREKIILESRFFNDKKIKDIAKEYNISSSRVSRIIQSSLDKVKEKLNKQELI